MPTKPKAAKEPAKKPADPPPAPGRKCLNCEVIFTSNRAWQKWHSKECRDDWKRKEADAFAKFKATRTING